MRLSRDRFQENTDFRPIHLKRFVLCLAPENFLVSIHRTFQNPDSFETPRSFPQARWPYGSTPKKIRRFAGLQPCHLTGRTRQLQHLAGNLGAKQTCSKLPLQTQSSLLGGDCFPQHRERTSWLLSGHPSLLASARIWPGLHKAAEGISEPTWTKRSPQSEYEGGCLCTSCCGTLRRSQGCCYRRRWAY